jgi:hypothetical protein
VTPLSRLGTPARLQERFGHLAISEEDPTLIFQMRKLLGTFTSLYIFILLHFMSDITSCVVSAIISELGKGSFGFVYHAFDTRRNIDVAIKVRSIFFFTSFLLFVLQDNFNLETVDLFHCTFAGNFISGRRSN